MEAYEFTVTSFATLKQVQKIWEAQQLVDKAYTTILIDEAWGTREPQIDVYEMLRRWSEKSKYGACRDIVKRKPWFWDYKPTDQCDEEGAWLCGEFWATVTHNVVGSVLYR